MSKTDRYDAPDLPPDSVLTLQEYLAMQRAIGEETRYRALATLLEAEELSASELAAELGVATNTLHYHLDRLVDVGLVNNRKRKERGADGLYSYYVPTALGEAMMTHGVGELLREERDLLERYS